MIFRCLTEYSIGNELFSSEVYFPQGFDEVALMNLRSLHNERIVGDKQVIWDKVNGYHFNYYEFIKLNSAQSFFERGMNLPAAHRVAFLLSIKGNQAKALAAVSDRGLLHELFHDYRNSGLQAKELSKLLFEFEESVPGTFQWASTGLNKGVSNE